MKKKYFIMVLAFILFPCRINAEDTLETKIDTLYNNSVNLNNNGAFLNAHPVGSIYMTISSDESTITKMATKYGGTWEVYASGKTIIGYKSSDSSFNTIDKTGGSKTTTLTVDNLPSHSHTISHTHSTSAISTSSGNGSHSHTVTGGSSSSISLSTSSSGNHTHALRSDGYGTAIVLGSTTTIIAASTGFQGKSNGLWSGSSYPKGRQSIVANGAHTHTVSGTISIPSLSIASSGNHTHTAPALTTSGSSVANSGSTGSGVAFTNLMPYTVIYMYKRVS